MLSPALLALALVLFILLLAPVSRLRRSGWSPRAAGVYLGVMLLAGLLAAELPGIGRYLGPLLALAYVTPYVAARLGFGRLRTQPGPTVVVERPVIKQVHGPARDVPSREPSTVTPEDATVARDEATVGGDDPDRSDRPEGE